MRGFTRGDGLAFFVNRGYCFSDVIFPIRGQFAFHAALEFGSFFRERSFVLGEFIAPQRFQALAFGAAIPAFVNIFWNLERPVSPAQVLARGFDFGIAQCSTVYVVRAFFVRRALADNGFANNHRRFVGDGFGFLQRFFYRLRVVSVDITDHVPVISFEALAGIVGEPGFDVAVDGDAVIVVKSDQLAQAPGAGQRAGFV